MHYVYLDQNIIDRIDKGLKEEVVKFLEENRFIPVVSFTSLDEIEHGNHTERTCANIQALIEIGASIICEGNSELLITKIARADKVFELLRKNSSISRIVRCLETIQFCKIISTSRYELKMNLTVLLNDLKYLLDNLNENFSQPIKNDLLRIIDFENELINQVPDEFHFISDFRLSLSLTPKEINNLNLKDLWEKIESLNNRGLLNLDLSHENPKTRLYNHLLLLNLIGYWCDNIDKEKKQVAFNYDCEHGIYGSLCHSITSSDKRFLKRLRAAYYRMSIPTKIFHLSGNVFNELD